MAARTIESERPAPDEAAKVLEWRVVQLFRAGYDPEEAGLLAVHTDVDLHEALRLVERGCPPKTALRILL
jgi:hypothetical protein